MQFTAMSRRLATHQNLSCDPTASTDPPTSQRLIRRVRQHERSQYRLSLREEILCGCVAESHAVGDEWAEELPAEAHRNRGREPHARFGGAVGCWIDARKERGERG